MAPPFPLPELSPPLLHLPIPPIAPFRQPRLPFPLLLTSPSLCRPSCFPCISIKACPLSRKQAIARPCLVAFLVSYTRVPASSLCRHHQRRGIQAICVRPNRPRANTTHVTPRDSRIERAETRIYNHHHIIVHNAVQHEAEVALAALSWDPRARHAPLSIRRSLLDDARVAVPSRVRPGEEAKTPARR